MPLPAAVEGAIARESRVSLEGTTEGRGLSWSDVLTLGVIGLVVVLVSLPRLRRFALRENETDALRALRALSAHGAPGASALPRLDDLEVLPGGVLRRHGYLFDRAEDEDGGAVWRAWPWEYGRTGLGAFAAVSKGLLLGYPNPDGLYDGLDQPPPVRAILADSVWVRLR
jgi:hypothetical protein